MFERLRNALSRRPVQRPGNDPVAHWAMGHFLRHQSLGQGRFEVSGQLHERRFQAECGPSSRAYIQGLELRARVDLGLPPVGHVIVMSQVVRTALEVQADGLYRQAVNALQTSAQALPEEVRWLSMFRAVRWRGPDERFWQAYAVLSDAAELAQRWLDDEALDYLLTGTSEKAAQVPVLVMLARGRCYLRLQVNPHAQGADALLALELLEHLSERALLLAGRSGAAEGEPLNNPG